MSTTASPSLADAGASVEIAKAETAPSDESASLPAQEQSPRAPVPEATGTFQWSRSNYFKDSDCDYWQSETLSLSIDEHGDATWSAFANSEGACSSGTMVPTHCGIRGSGYVERAGKRVRLVTERRGRYGGGGTPVVTALWLCGRIKLHAPPEWEPRSGQCVRLGSEPDPDIERISEIACQYIDLFPELNEQGVPLRIKGGTISFQHEKKVVGLKRTKASTAGADGATAARKAR